MIKDYSRCWCEIDYKLIKHNVNEIKKLVGSTKIMAVVKANAYGHDMIECVKYLKKEKIDFFAVSSIDEAIEFRKVYKNDKLLILGYTSPKHFHFLHELNIIQSCLSYEYGIELNNFAKINNIKIKCHIKIDTGMNRTGLIYQQLDSTTDLIEEVYRLSNIKCEGIFSHFAVSDQLTKDSKQFTLNQIKLFKDLIFKLEAKNIKVGLKHIQNSYGILNYKDLGFDYCRPGLLYMGVTQLNSYKTISKPDLKPILKLYANISLIKTINQGDTVSYGRNFTAIKPTKVATISIGYADGLPRSLSNKNFEVYINNCKAKIIGNICMDQCMVDVTNIDCKVHDKVTIIGTLNPVDNISKIANTINNETLCAISYRVPRLPMIKR